MRLSRFVAGLVSLGWLVVSPTAARGLTVHALDAADVGAWLDGTMSYGVQAGDVAGAVVVVVKDGQVLVARGYGFADVAAGRRVDPERTLFRLGSISKLFTWTAMMQLVEAGALDLDRDVNAYLDFRLPPHAGKPITLRELATHTAGFEDILKGLSAADGAPVPGLGEAVKAELPARIYPAGEVTAYCNYGAALAGYIVQRVSGEPFAAYVARHILQPDRNGRAIAGHAGDTTMFHSDLHLFLDDRVGLYVSMNGSGREGAARTVRKLLFQEFTDRYFPAPLGPLPAALPVARAEHDAALAAGAYVSSRRVESGFPKLAALLGEITVRVGAGGTLVIDSLRTPGGAVKRWREVAPFLWQEIGGTARLVGQGIGSRARSRFPGPGLDRLRAQADHRLATVLNRRAGRRVTIEVTISGPRQTGTLTADAKGKILETSVF